MLPAISKGLTPAQRTKKDSAVIAKGASFNPLTYDAANLLALYDGDAIFNIPLVNWDDESANNYNLTLFNTPTHVPNAINGHTAIRFDGINQDARNTSGVAINQPCTQYIVFKPITFGAGTRIYSFPGGGFLTYYQQFVSPNTWLYAGLNLGNLDVPLNNFQLVTNVFNGANSAIRANNLAAMVGDAGANNGINIYLAGDGATWNNCEIAYFIVRNGADSTATQNLFINWLKTRFAL